MTRGACCTNPKPNPNRNRNRNRNRNPNRDRNPNPNLTLTLTRYLLHAWRLSYPHPVSGAQVTVHAPPPAALCAAGEEPLEEAAASALLADPASVYLADAVTNAPAAGAATAAG